MNCLDSALETIWLKCQNISENTQELPQSQPSQGTNRRRDEEQTMIKQMPYMKKKSKRKVQGVPQSQTAALPRHQEEEETDKTNQAQIE